MLTLEISYYITFYVMFIAAMQFINKCLTGSDDNGMCMHRSTAGEHLHMRALSTRCDNASPCCLCMHGSLPVTRLTHHQLATKCHSEIL